ncbi:MAG TPA: CopG family transcriptional regulator [candidate division Zixibacteria bacterium]|nr:CopG family transcriptional regulator [candidate division Zixibacteria bacterium]
MKRTTIMLDPALLAELERIARRSRRPTAQVIRESLERYVAEAREQEGGKLPPFVGMFAGGEDENVAERADEILREELPAHLMREREG